MSLLSSVEGEYISQIFGFGLSLDSCQNRSINSLLSVFLSLRNLSFLQNRLDLGRMGENWGRIYLLLSVLEELLLFGSLSILLLGEVSISDVVGVNSGNIDDLGGGEGMLLWKSQQWHAINLVWSGNKDISRLELFKEDNSLSSESS